VTGGKTDYVVLIASLPPLPLSLWDLKNKPVTRLTLERQLKLLSDKDSEQLQLIESILHWAKIEGKVSDETIATEAKRVIATIDNPLLQSMVIWRLELRTIIAAIRRRKLALKAPDIKQSWGYGSVVSSIKKNWQMDDFALSNRFPWIKKANSLFEADRSIELEKLLLNLSWQRYERMGQGHYFDFAAVVVYVLRWDIINRWAQCDEMLAMQQFELLVNQGLGEFLPANSIST